MRTPDPEQLPTVARLLIGWLAGPLYREHVLGDLQEELWGADGRNVGRLRIWKEVFAAIPGLIALRVQALDFRSIGLTLFVTLAAYIALVLWSLNVTRPILIGMRDSFADGPSWDYLYFYMLVRLPSVFLVGVGIAFLTFQPMGDFRRNFMRRLLLLLLIVILPQIWFMIADGQEEFVAGRIIRAFADGAVLCVAAYLGHWLKRRQLDK